MKIKYLTKEIEVDAILFENTESGITQTAEFVYNVIFTDEQKKQIIKVIRSNNGIYLKDNNSKVHFGEYIIKNKDNFYIMNPILFNTIFLK